MDFLQIFVGIILGTIVGSCRILFHTKGLNPSTRSLDRWNNDQLTFGPHTKNVLLMHTIILETSSDPNDVI